MIIHFGSVFDGLKQKIHYLFIPVLFFLQNFTEPSIANTTRIIPKISKIKLLTMVEMKAYSQDLRDKVINLHKTYKYRIKAISYIIFGIILVVLAIKHPNFALPGRKALINNDMDYEVVLVDATESPIERERPKKNRGYIIQERRKGIH